MIAFKLDENVPTYAVRELRARGFDALSVLDQSLHGVPDTSLSQVCKSEQRCLMTMDLDFADLRVFDPGKHYGIIVIRLNDQSLAQVLKAIDRIIQTLQNETVQGTLWIVDEQRIRIRE